MGNLTARENEVLQLIKTGSSNREIALTMSVSIHTAKAHVSSIIDKLKAKDRTNLVRIAFKMGLID